MVSVDVDDLKAIRIFRSILKSLHICDSILNKLRKSINCVRTNSYQRPHWKKELSLLTDLRDRFKEVQSPMRALVFNVFDSAYSPNLTAFKARRDASYRPFERPVINHFSRYGRVKQGEKGNYRYVELQDFIPFIISYGRLLLSRFISSYKLFLQLLRRVNNG